MPLYQGFDYFYGIPHVGQKPHIIIENERVLGLNPNDPLRIELDPRHRGRRSFHQRMPFPPAHRFHGGANASYHHDNLAIHLTRKAVDQIRTHGDSPLFLYVAHRNVHTPLRPHATFAGSSTIGAYGDFIHELDWSVGEILKALDDRGMTDDTLLLFSSDNGAVAPGYRPAQRVDYRGHRANGPLRGQKTEVYEGGHRVPLLCRWPGHVTPGSVSGALVALTDVMATCAELLNHPLPARAGEDSISFLAALLDTAPTEPVRHALIGDSNQGLFAIRQGRWKLIVNQGGGGIGWDPNRVDSTIPPQQLFDMDADPGEHRNLFEQHPDIVDRLTRLLAQARTSGRSRELFSAQP